MKLQVDIKKIIKLLAKDIYDSPYALLRENLQNAYDAVLMRKANDDTYNDPCIRMTVSNGIITVSDNGIGMTKENKERIFERFFRVDKSRSREKGGSGLGLSIVKHIVEIHNADIVIDSEPGKGTIIRVFF